MWQGIIEAALAVALTVVLNGGAMKMATPPPAQPPTAAVSAVPDVDAYVAAVQPALGRLGGGVEGMAAVMGAPALASQEWQARAAAAFADVEAGHAALVEISAPAPFGDVHAALTAATQHCADGAAAAQAAIDEGNVLALYAAAQLLTVCGDGITQVGGTLEGMR